MTRLWWRFRQQHRRANDSCRLDPKNQVKIEDGLAPCLRHSHCLQGTKDHVGSSFEMVRQRCGQLAPCGAAVVATQLMASPVKEEAKAAVATHVSMDEPTLFVWAGDCVAPAASGGSSCTRNADWGALRDCRNVPADVGST